MESLEDIPPNVMRQSKQHQRIWLHEHVKNIVPTHVMDEQQSKHTEIGEGVEQAARGHWSAALCVEKIIGIGRLLEIIFIETMQVIPLSLILKKWNIQEQIIPSLQRNCQVVMDLTMNVVVVFF